MERALLDRLKAQMAAEFARTGPPEGFPAFHDIPTGRYTDPAFHALEQEHLWPKVWVMAGRSEQVARPGDHLTFDDLGVPTVIVRGSDGEVRAFANTCQHRGAPVVRDRSGSAPHLRCQYHGWTYDLDDGRLVSVPDERDFVGLCRDDRRLAPMRCEEWDGWVFVNRDPKAAPLRDWYGPILDELTELQGASLRQIAVRSATVACNWKVTAEAFLEVYHFRHIHARGPAGGATALDHRGAAMGLLPHGSSRMVTPFSRAACQARGMADWADWRPLADPALADIPTVNEMIRSTSTAYSLFPNLITPLGSIGFPFLLFWPLDIRTTRLDWIWYAPVTWEGDDLPDAWVKRLAVFDEIMEEDTRNMAPMQRSLESPALRGVVVNYQERRIWHLHEQIDRTIGVERIPKALRVEPVLARFVEQA